MGGHTLPGEGKSKIWLTPPDLLSRLGEFDLDPCAAPSPRPWPTATRHIELPEDGLRAKWIGRVWLNPPYTQGMDEWIGKMIHHGSGITLIFARTETALWQNLIWPNVHGILFLDGRLTFFTPDGKLGTSNSGAPSVLLAHSENDVVALRNSGLRGYLVVDSQRLG